MASTSRKISESLRNSVWIQHIGNELGKSKCCCCGLQDIDRGNYECGHIISRSCNGETTLDNLRPVCSKCNKSMGAKNMYEFMKECGYKLEISECKQHDELIKSLNVRCDELTRDLKAERAKYGKLYFSFTESLRKLSELCSDFNKQFSDQADLGPSQSEPVEVAIDSSQNKTAGIIESSYEGKKNTSQPHEILTKTISYYPAHYSAFSCEQLYIMARICNDGEYVSDSGTKRDMAIRIIERKRNLLDIAKSVDRYKKYYVFIRKKDNIIGRGFFTDSECNCDLKCDTCDLCLQSNDHYIAKYKNPFADCYILREYNAAAYISNDIVEIISSIKPNQNYTYLGFTLKQLGIIGYMCNTRVSGTKDTIIADFADNNLLDVASRINTGKKYLAVCKTYYSFVDSDKQTKTTKCPVCKIQHTFKIVENAFYDYIIK